MPFRIRILLLLVFCFPLTGPSCAEPGSKLDAVLKTAIGQVPPQQWRGRVAGARRQDHTVGVLVKTLDGGEELERVLVGFHGQITSRHGDILALRLPVEALSKVDALTSVAYIEASHSFFSQLDEVSKAEGVNLSGVRSEYADVTGRGVVVGIIDTGIDTAKAAFQTPEGETRVLYTWDQYDDNSQRRPRFTRNDGSTQVLDFGAEYTSADIDSGFYVGTDIDGHGTHVAGIAAGRDALFPGMAPQSSLISVINDGGDDESGFEIFDLSGSGPNLDAYSYMISRRDELGLPMVVNQSQGTLMGPHDGSSLYEQALQNDIEQHNFLICISAGNDQLEDKHALDSIPAHGTATIDLAFEQEIPEADVILANSVEVWFDQGPQPRLSVELYDDEEFTTLVGTVGPLSFEQVGRFDIPNTDRSVVVEKELPSALNGDNRFFLTLVGAPTDDDSLYLRLVFENSNGASQPVDLYVQQGNDTMFVSDLASRSGTLGVPGTTPGAITVGAYTTRTQWTDVDGNIANAAGTTLYALAPFSSIGPPRNLALYQGVNAVKPDLCAPGDAIVSQLSSQLEVDDDDRREIFEDGEHLVYSGTSMSTPVVAGVVALMLQDNPVATPEQIKTWLFEGCRSDSFTGAVPNDEWGHGKLDALAAFQAVVSPQPILSKVTLLPVELSGQQHYRLSGERIALSHQILVDGVALAPSAVEWIDHREVRFEVVADRQFSTITVVNLKAPVDRRSATLAVDSESGGGTPISGQGGAAFLPDSSGGFCFIATAAYGSPLEPKVAVLRNFRDRCLLKNSAGRAFVDYYYRTSPPFALYIARHETARTAVRLALTPIVWTVAQPAWSAMLAFSLMLGVLTWRRRRSGVLPTVNVNRP